MAILNWSRVKSGARDCKRVEFAKDSRHIYIGTSPSVKSSKSGNARLACTRDLFLKITRCTCALAETLAIVYNLL